MARGHGVSASWFDDDLHVTIDGPLDLPMAVLVASLLQTMQATAPAPARAVLVHTERVRRVDPRAKRLLEQQLPAPWRVAAIVLFVGPKAGELRVARRAAAN